MDNWSWWDILGAAVIAAMIGAVLVMALTVPDSSSWGW